MSDELHTDPNAHVVEPPALAVGPQLLTVLELAYWQRLAVLLEGGTGIGKSSVVEQVARKLGIGFVVIDTPLHEPGDLLGLPFFEEGHTRFASPHALPREGAGILMFEEINRAERHVQQATLQLLTARRLHEYVLPEGWSMVAAINPEDGDYHVTPLDPALRSRFMQLRVRAERESWLGWARENGVHPSILRLAQLHDRMLDEVPPRSWAYASRVLDLATHASANAAVLRAALGGYLPGPWLELLLHAAEIEDEASDPAEEASVLLRVYHVAEHLRERVQGWVKEGRLDRIDELYRGLFQALSSERLGWPTRRGGYELDAMEAIFEDLPGDLREGLQEAFAGNPEAAKRLPIEARDVVGGYRRNGAVRRQVRSWLRQGRSHRVLALTRAVAAELSACADPVALRSDPAVRSGLGLFLADLGKHRALELVRAIEVLEIDVDTPQRRGGSHA